MEDLSINTDHPSRVGMDGIILRINKNRDVAKEAIMKAIAA